MKRLVLAIALLAPSFAFGEEIEKIFENVVKLKNDGNYAKAINELTWASKELERMNVEKLKSFLPDTVSGFTGQEVTANAVMGLTSIERNYSKDDISVKVSLTNTSGNSGLGGGFAGLGQLAAAFGGQAGLNSFRIDGNTANLEVNQQRKSAELTVFLQSGSILKLDMSNSSDGELLKGLAEGLKLGEIDTYLKGMS